MNAVIRNQEDFPEFPVDADALSRYIQRSEQREEHQKNIQYGVPLANETPERIDYRMRTLRCASEEACLERIFGRSDLVSVCYLDYGRRAARSVGRINIRNAIGTVCGYATGFMVSPRLMLTNHHVFSITQDAVNSLVDFNYQDSDNGIPLEPTTFAFAPDKFFVSDQRLDYALVAVKPVALDNVTNLSQFGWVPLFEDSGKALIGEHLTVIQHPNGERKQIALRENELQDVVDDFVQYPTDTKPGSSGSPAFNDQWQVVALHHSGIPDTNDQGQWLAKDGNVWQPVDGEDEIAWKANEGVRISSICRNLRSQILDPIAKLLLEQALPMSNDQSDRTEMLTEKLTVENYVGRTGYDPDFLGTGICVSLPQLSSDMQTVAAKSSNSSGGKPNYVLDYTHFSIVMNARRRIAFFTAANIDGRNYVEIKRTKDSWYIDPRIKDDEQSDPSLYAHNCLDRGHLVRREDPNWGNLAQQANEETFHFTNCSPQHSLLNQRIWLELEDYILGHAKSDQLKVCVFTGPVFRENDHPYMSYRIPAQFWKVAVMQKEDGTVSATGYLQSQKDMVDKDLPFINEALEFYYGEYQTYQVPITRIEALTMLNFGDLRNFDPIGKLEAYQPAAINSFEAIRF